MPSELQELVDEAAALLGAPVTLEDRDFTLVAFAAHPGPVDAVRHASILQRRSSARVRAHFESFGIATAAGPVHVPGGGTGPARIAPRLCLPARARGVTYGYLWALEEGTPVAADRAGAAMRLADRAGAVLAQQARARADVGRLLEDLLSADAEAAERAADELDARGLAARHAPVAVVVVTSGGDGAPGTAGGPGAASPWSLPRDVLALPGADALVLLVPAGRPAGPAEAAERAVRAFEDVGVPQVVAGIGEAVADPVAARQSLRHARVAARVARAGRDGSGRDGSGRDGSGNGPAGPVRAWADLGVHRLLACGTGTLADAVLDPAVLRLLGDPAAGGAAGDADREELVRTARCWLDAACSPARAAQELGVHRQTLYARLERIERITGLRLVGGRPDGRDRTRLHVALALAPLLR